MFNCRTCGSLMLDQVDYSEEIRGRSYFTVESVNRDGTVFVEHQSEDEEQEPVEDTGEFQCSLCGNYLDVNWVTEVDRTW